MPHPKAQAKLPDPPPGAKRWLRYLVGFGVSVALGAAPFLGTLHVPGFSPMLSLFPELPWDTKRSVIPVASLVMGICAVVIQFWGRDGVGRQKLRSWFYRSVVLTTIALLILAVLHPFLVVSYEVPAQNAEVSVLVSFSRPDSCVQCDPSESNVECLDNTTLAAGVIRSCWSDRGLGIAYLALALPYWMLMSSFGLMVGLLMLYEEARKRKRRAG